MSESLREQMAQEIFSHDGEIDDWVETTQEIRDVYLGIADSILPLIRKAVEELENPYHLFEYGDLEAEKWKAAEKMRQSLLKLLEVKDEAENTER